MIMVNMNIKAHAGRRSICYQEQNGKILSREERTQEGRPGGAPLPTQDVVDSITGQTKEGF